MIPFLTVVTRCNNRPELLYRNLSSWSEQSDQDFDHILLFDGENRGVEWANSNIAVNKDRVHGEYVYVLDDDDYLHCKDFVKILKKVAKENGPDVIMVKMYHGPSGKDLPDVGHWGSSGVFPGHVGTPCFVVRRDVWKRHIDSFQGKSMGDYRFIKELFEENYKIYWLDIRAAKVDAARFGGPGY